jgi:hypothetical protein
MPQLQSRFVAQLALRAFPTVSTLAVAALPVAAQTKVLGLTNTSTGNSSYVRTADAPELEPQRFTLEARIRPTGAGFGQTGTPFGATILTKPLEGTTGGFLCSWALGWEPSTSRVYAMVVNTPNSIGRFVYSNTTIPLGVERHIAATFDGATLALFVDGELDAATATSFSSVYYGNEDVLIGASNLGAGFLRRFTGEIDEVRIWDHARDERAIALLAGCRLTGQESGLRLYYNFNASNALDLSGGGSNGALVGSAFTFANEMTVLSACGSPSINYCTAGTTTNGCLASIGAAGVASVSQSSGFVVAATQVEGQKAGLVFYGLSGASATPWLGGSSSFLCVKSPTQRSPTLASGGVAGACNGVLALDLLAYLNSNPSSLGQPFGGGEALFLQAWFRDPGAPSGTNLSNGLCVVLAP